MRKLLSIVIISIVIGLIAACHSQQPVDEEQVNVGTSTSIEGDSTLYGLACDGCTDTVLVFLPGKGGDPITYNILDATKKGRIIGRPTVGDWVAVILNGQDPEKADMVINLDELKGTWVEQKMPVERHRMVQSAVTPEEKMIQDSIIKSLMKPIEIGFSLKRHYTAQPYGMRRRSANADKNSPVIFPSPKFYTEWHVFNGKLVLTIGDPRSLGKSDTSKQNVLGHEALERVKQLAAQMPTTLAAFVGSSGRSVKVLARVEKTDGTVPQTEAEANDFLQAAYDFVVAPYQALMSYAIQRQPATTHTSFRMTLDEKPFFRPKATAFQIADIVPTMNSTPVEAVASSPNYDLYMEYERLYMQAMVKTNEMAGDDPNDNAFFAELARQMCLLGIPEEEAFTHVWDHHKYNPPLPKMRLRTIIEAA